MKIRFYSISSVVLFAALTTRAADFREYPIGDEVEKNHIKVAAVYFPAVVMDHSAMGGAHAAHGVSIKDLAKEKFIEAGKELIHIEADIHATTGNPNGFGAGEWIPYLTVKFKLFKSGEKAPVLAGEFMPMVAKDGPHYGTSIRMPGKGSYKLEYEISPPVLARHSDAVTGVAEYWKGFVVTYDFEYKGIAK